MRKVVSLALLALLVGCGERTATESTGTAASEPTRLVQASTTASSGGGVLPRVFDPDMLGAQVAYLETFTGPAWRVDRTTAGGEIRRYKIGRCVADVLAQGGTINGLGMDVSPQCTFQVKPFAPNQAFGAAHQLRFGDLQGAMYDADCLRSCGNAADPWVFADWEGSHADNFRRLRVGAPQVSDAVLAAADAWEEALISAKGEDWLIMEFACSPDRFSKNAVATKAFAKVPIERIEIGGPFDEGVC